MLPSLLNAKTQQRNAGCPALVCLTIGLCIFLNQSRAQEQELSYIATDVNHRAGHLPTFFDRETPKGSPYFVQGWLRGVVQLANQHQIPEKDQSLFFNYDKLNNQLFVTDGVDKIWSYPGEFVSGFALVDSMNTYAFEKIPWISNEFFLQQLLKSPRGYSLYKRLITKLKPANYKSVGYYSTGNKYDEYTDFYEYYIIYPGEKIFKKFYLNEGAIRKALKGESVNLDNFFTGNSGPLNEEKLLAMMRFINDKKE